MKYLAKTFRNNKMEQIYFKVIQCYANNTANNNNDNTNKYKDPDGLICMNIWVINFTIAYRTQACGFLG